LTSAWCFRRSAPDRTRSDRVGGLGALVAAVLFASNEIGYRIGVHRAQRRPAGEQEHIGIGTITPGMLGLLAFTLSLTINIAQNRYEARRGLVLQEANSVQAAWLRSKLIGGERGPPITAMIEEFAKVQLAYVGADRFEDEEGLIARKTALEAQIWQAMQVLSLEQPTNATSGRFPLVPRKSFEASKECVGARRRSIMSTRRRVQIARSDRCTNGAFRSVSRLENEAVLDRVQTRLQARPRSLPRDAKRSSTPLAPSSNG
jgi:hypothetical protein